MPKDKTDITRYLKKYCKFIILIYCHYVINIFNSLIDTHDIHYLLLIRLINNFITNIFLKSVKLYIKLRDIKNIINEGCSIILDYIIISKEEKFNNNKYIPKFTDAIQFSYQKVIPKVNKHNPIPDGQSAIKGIYTKKRSNKAPFIVKSDKQDIANIQANTISNNISNNIHSLSLDDKNGNDENTFNGLLHSCIEIINCLFINLIKMCFINHKNDIKYDKRNDLFYNLSYFIEDTDFLCTYDNCQDDINQSNNGEQTNNEDQEYDNTLYTALDNILELDNEKRKKTTVITFINELTYNIDIIEDYMIILSNEIISILKDNKKHNLDVYYLINAITLGFKNIQTLHTTTRYNYIFYNLLYIILPFLLIKNSPIFINNKQPLLQLINNIIEWYKSKQDWIINLYNPTIKHQFITISILNKINQQFIASCNI